jgi:hypothetical protein
MARLEPIEDGLTCIDKDRIKVFRLTMAFKKSPPSAFAGRRAT